MSLLEQLQANLLHAQLEHQKTMMADALAHQRAMNKLAIETATAQRDKAFAEAETAKFVVELTKNNTMRDLELEISKAKRDTTIAQRNTAKMIEEHVANQPDLISLPKIDPH
ncbi:MAG: hypothetical protein MJA83_11715 [Gammaproteobacteria bacterium]|nr:hypothetical protein [Gammaproteobacteria bacterium]